MFGWLRRSVKSNHELRDEIACSMRAVRAACTGRACMRQCLRRIASAAPLRRFPSRGGAAAACAALLLFSRAAFAVVECVWTGSGYSCSGSGDAVHVIGGIPGGDGDVVVTNIVGTCTNCVAMSPQYVHDWKQNITSNIVAELFRLDSVRSDCSVAIQFLIPYAKKYPVYEYPGSNAALTNLLVSLGLPVSGASQYPVNPVNRPAEIAASMPQGSAAVGTVSSVAVYRRHTLQTYNAAAAAYNDVADSVIESTNFIQRAERETYSVQNRLSELTGVIDQLSEEACTAQWDGDSSDSPDHGSGIVTNQAGNWCTFDQGEAIKDLLREVKEYNDEQLSQLRAISNSVESIDDNIRRALFTTYNHIPTESELGSTWQELYLSGYSPNFHAYQSTNILARIELLLAGISGVLTNSNEYAEADELADEVADTTDELQSSLESVKTSFEDAVTQQSQKSQSIGAALLRLYQKFRQWTGVPFSTESVIRGYSIDSISVDGEPVDIPGVSMREQDVSWANMVRVVVRSLMSVVYFLFTIAVFVRFHIAFFQWCWKYVRWAIEVMQGFFA